MSEPGPELESIDIDELPDALAGQRLDRIVAIVADVTRSQAASLVSAGAVVVDGQPVTKTSLRVPAGTSLRFTVDRRAPGPGPDPTIEVPVVHVDDDVVVVDKPAGIVVHPGSGVEDGTLVNGLLARFPELAGIGEPERPGIVHRLDRGTSGLLLVARTAMAHRSLGEQLRDRSVERRYRTLVIGHVEAESGLIDAPLGRDPGDRTRRAVVAGGRTARTHYDVSERFETGSGPDRLASTLVGCRLETGRTHQIRVHLAAIGHPVAGDGRYGGAVDRTALDGILHRPFLHAEVVGFTHPRTGRRLRYTAPLAPDLERALAVVRGDR